MTKAWKFAESEDLKALESKRKAMVYRLNKGLYAGDGLTEEEAKDAVSRIKLIIQAKKTGKPLPSAQSAYSAEKEASYAGKKTGFVWYGDERLPCKVVSENCDTKGRCFSLEVEFLPFERVRATYAPFVMGGKKVVSPNLFHEDTLNIQTQYKYAQEQ